MAGAPNRPRALPTYTLAYEGPLSGGYVALGLNMKYGVQYAVYKWNQTKGRKFNLKAMFLDDQGDPSKAPTEAHIATGNSHVIGVVGPAFSGATLPRRPSTGQRTCRSSARRPPTRRLGPWPRTRTATSSASSLTTACRVRRTPTTS